MTWPIDIATLSRNDRRLRDCIEDRALKTTALEHENARLRADLRDAQQAIETLRTAHAATATELLQAEQIIQRLVADSRRVPFWQISRWVRFGPMAAALVQYTSGRS
ncbi:MULTISPECIES: hypothetical protein [unclassified Cupriavidus]|uniref:hypothetical protein n=1 Tax=unclassified Cupriavidus TaxID=2640874 RepID=UPI00313D0C50